MLADTTKSGRLYFPEFALAMYLCNMVLVGKPLPRSLPENIKGEITEMIEWIISWEPTDARLSAPRTKPPDFNILQGLKQKFAPQQAYPGPSTVLPVQQNGFQGGYGSLLSQNSGMQPQYDPRDLYVHPPSPLSQLYASTVPQPYASTIPQDDGRSSQQKQRNVFSKLLSVGDTHFGDIYMY
jgi:hypothetical protein